MADIVRCLIVIIAFFVLAACSSGPRWRAQEFSRAVDQRQADEISGMFEERKGRAIEEEVLVAALSKGRVGELPLQSDWDMAKASATVRMGSNIYLLSASDGEWKIRCATIGPFHDRSPEMTLLLALHLIGKGDFEAFRRLAPSDLEQRSDDLPESFRDELRKWAKELKDRVCIPFELRGDDAILKYGSEGRKILRMRLEGPAWKIHDLW